MNLGAEGLVRAVCRRYEIAPALLCASSTRGSPRAAEARAVLCYLLRTRAALSFPEIGRLVGRDHSSVIDACARVRADPGMLAQAAHVLDTEEAGGAMDDALDWGTGASGPQLRLDGHVTLRLDDGTTQRIEAEVRGAFALHRGVGRDREPWIVSWAPAGARLAGFGDLGGALAFLRWCEAGERFPAAAGVDREAWIARARAERARLGGT